MKKQLSLLFVVLLLLVGCSDRQPDMVTHEGKKMSLRDFRGHWVIVNYWASWCAPCLEEMSELNRFYKKYHDRGVDVLGVSYDPLSIKQLADFRKLYHVDYPMVQHFPLAKLGIKAVEVVPTTLVLGPKGRFRKELLGPQTVRSLEAVIKR